MSRKRIAIIRAPFTYRYNCLDVREDAIVSYLYGYLEQIGLKNIFIFDYHLDRELTFEKVCTICADAYVIVVRETGDNIHYVLRLANALAYSTSSEIILYGQTTRLHNLSLPKKIKICRHNEQELATLLGLDISKALVFAQGLKIKPYINTLPLAVWQKNRIKGSIETTRGCVYKCKFCFINVGNNYGFKWKVRPTNDIIIDLQTYITLGIRNFVFNDSEFLGGSNKDFLLKRELLNRIITDLPPIKYKIYCRADTLEKFNDYQTLKKSGLVSVFIGVESLYQSDLDALNKDLNVNTTINAIRNLRKHKIYSDLSFIFFNHNTNTQSIRDNLDKIEMLLNESAGRYMGMPYFSFSFESGWSESEYMNNWISKKTYLKYDVLMKTPAAKGACFDTNLEPLMEVYRLLAYEWSKKVIFLNQVRSNCDKDSQILIEVWFQKLAMFCVKTMKYFLDEFVQGHLQLTNLPSSKLRLYEKIQDYYLILPEKMRQLETFDVHANKIDYQDTSGLVENDEYWTQQIPWRNAFDFHSQEELNKILEN